MTSLDRIRAWWSRLAPRSRLAALGAVAAVAIGALVLVTLGVGRGCSSRADVEARVALTSSALQQAAAQGKLKVEELASAVKGLNAAATHYETNKDASAFCEVLDNMTGDLDTD